MAININLNLPQNGISNSCPIHGGNNPMAQMGGLGQQNQMNGMMGMLAMNMMAMMIQLMQMLQGGIPMSGTPGQFGGGGISGDSPVGGFLGGGSSGGASGTGATGSSSAAAPAGNVDPSSVKDKTGTNGLTAASKNGLQIAHTYGLPLVSGKRNGSGTSDHNHGNAIDVSTLPIGAASSTEGTSQMKAFAERMRQDGKAGRNNVKYVIADGKIASAKNNWEWRPYTYPGKSQAQLEALKRSNRGEYNRIQHYDHVHVSFK